MALVASLEESFQPPGAERFGLGGRWAPPVPVDLVLVYSQSFAENDAALTAASNVQAAWEVQNQTWHTCFRQVVLEQANLSADQDVYDSRGYTVRKDWVNGPNSVFRFVLGSFYEGNFSNYDAFYFMELDAVPVQPWWLEQFVGEALYYPRAAIRGSRYRGDGWDQFIQSMPADLLMHINGNAIYNVRHPWLRWLHEQLESEAGTENASVAFDLRMANLTLSAQAGLEPMASAYAELVPEGEEPYRDDSTLIGNFANTLLNSSFESGVYVRHGSLSNIFTNLEENITLGVAVFSDSYGELNATINSTHPFRDILVLSYAEPVMADGYTESIMTPKGDTEVRFKTASKDNYLALCEIAGLVTTKFFVFSDNYHLISGPTFILADETGRPVLPYVHANSSHCATAPACLLSLQQAEDLFGIKLHYHHDNFDTVYHTSEVLEFCDQWELASSDLGSYENCGIQFGPTADDFFAWQISVGRELGYVPKDKERVGWRSFTLLREPVPLDQRTCSVYTQTEYDRIAANLSTCSQIIEEVSVCEATPNCTFRPLFGSGGRWL
ncbi:unnamed protein product [Effrenium voratum]|nr:unnamed protein product [Effrenium voratum]